MKRILSCIAVLFACASLNAAPQAETTVDLQTMFVGDNLTLTASVVLDGGYFIIKPESGIEAGIWRVKNVDVKQTSPNAFLIDYTLTAYITGKNLELPSFEIFYSNAKGETGSFNTAAGLTVNIDSLLVNVSNYEEIKDIKPLEKLSVPKWIVIFFRVSVLFFAFAAGLGLWKLFKKYFKRKIKRADPFIEMQKSFNALLVKLTGTESEEVLLKMIDTGTLTIAQCKTLYYGLSEILRAYVDAKYNTNLSAQTGDFVYHGIKPIIETKFTEGLNAQEVLKQFSGFLKTAEKVKYAAVPVDSVQLKNNFNIIKILAEKL